MDHGSQSLQSMSHFNTGTRKRRKWTKGESDLLKQAIDFYEDNNWVKIATYVGTRTAKQCRERYKSFLIENIKTGAFSEDEQLNFDLLYKEVGKSWSVIAKSMPGRNHNMVKNYFNNVYNKNVLIKQDFVYQRYDIPYKIDSLAVLLDVGSEKLDEWRRKQRNK